MDKFTYVAMSGAAETMRLQNMHAHNLANVNSTGFRAQIDQIKTKALKAEGTFETRDYAYAGPMASNFESGPLHHTGNPLDAAIAGSGWFSTQDSKGQEAYTRAGSFHISAAGELLTAQGRAVLGTGGPIVLPPHRQVTVADDGTVSVIPVGQDNPVVIDRLKLVNPDESQLERHEESGLFRLKGAETQANPDPQVRIKGEHLEGSNVNPVASMIAMIDASRQYEMSLKMFKTASENAEISARIMQVH